MDKIEKTEITQSGRGSNPADFKIEAHPNQLLAWVLTLLTLGIIRFVEVPEGRSRIVTRWGKFVRQTKPGLSACLSFWGILERIEPGSIDTRVQTRDYPTKTIFTKDALECAIDTVIYFKITDAGKALYEVDNYELAIEDFIQATLRNECGRKAARDLLAGRNEINAALKNELASVTENWGIEIQRVEIKDIDFTHKDFTHHNLS